MLSSASIDTMTPQHEMNPTLAPGSARRSCSGKTRSASARSSSSQSIIRNCARAGIPAVKYNMNLIGVLRTADTPGRGGTRYSTWRLAEAKEEPPLTGGRPGLCRRSPGSASPTSSSASSPWPPNTGCGSPAIPHDPGVPPRGFRGVVRVLGTVEGMKRFVEIAASPYHGLNLCLGIDRRDAAGSRTARSTT